MKAFLIAALAIGLPVTVSAQEHANHGQQGEHHAPLVASAVTPLYSIAKTYLMASAEQASEELYAYQPTEEVRTFAQLIGHIANAQYMFCATAKGEKSPNTQNLERLATKAELVAALKGSFDYCDAVQSGMTDHQAVETINVFGNEMSRMGALVFNTSHNFEHYGNLVTYMRLNGMVPPSSQGM